MVNYTDLIGTPFRYGGRVLSDGGLDCYGVVVEMHRREGKQLPTRSVSEDHKLIHALMAAQMSVWKKLPGPKPGAVVLFRIKKLPCHIGYMVNEFEFIHAWEDSHVCVERLSTWEKRIEGFYEYVG